MRSDLTSAITYNVGPRSNQAHIAGITMLQKLCTIVLSNAIGPSGDLDGFLYELSGIAAMTLV
jgi:hypothetical protein